jgi:uncharacterized membrane protein
MLLVLFGLSLSIIIASALRRPEALWQRGLLLLAVMTFIAVCVAWSMEYFLGG